MQSSVCYSGGIHTNYVRVVYLVWGLRLLSIDVFTMAKQDKIDRMLERWSLQPEDLDVGPRVLGAGSFGEVRAGILRDGNSSIEVLHFSATSWN